MSHYQEKGLFMLVYALPIRQSGDIEVNPGPRSSPCHGFSICHRNLNGLTTHNYLKVSLLRACDAIKKFDVVCLSKTFLDSSNLPDYGNFDPPDYNVVRVDYPSNIKKGGASIYFKNSLPLKVLDIQLLQKCNNFEKKFADKACNFNFLYRSLCQSKYKFECFADNLEIILDSVAFRNPYLIFVLGNVNAQAKGWYPLGKTTYEGTRTDGITSQFRLEQLIHEPTHIIGERFPCIDLVCAPQRNLKVESGVQTSLHQNCYHQIVFARFNLKIVFPLPYEREVWHFKKANVDHNKQAINGFQWEKSFQNVNINDIVYLSNRTIKNILHNFSTDGIITCDGRDPPWIDHSIKPLIQNKNKRCLLCSIDPQRRVSKSM